MPVAIPILALALLVAVGLLGVAWSRVEGRDRALAELGRRMETTRATATSDPGRGADGYAMPQVYQGGFGFPPARPGSIRRPGPAWTRWPAACAARSAACRPDASWLVSVETGLARAADRRGLLVDDWALALLRLRVTAEYLVGHGIPAERLVRSFSCRRRGTSRRSAGEQIGAQPGLLPAARPG